MNKTLQEILEQQKATEKFLSQHSAAKSFSETYSRTNIYSISSILAQHKTMSVIDGFSNIFEKERLLGSQMSKYTAPVLPSYFDEAQKLAKQYSASIALSQIGSIVGPSSIHNLKIDEIVKSFELGSAFKSMAIGSAVEGWAPKIPALFASETFALEQFKHLGTLFNSGNVFGETSSKALRASLGDWRDNLVMPNLVQSLYVTQGFDRGLTELPDEQFFGVVSEAGLTHPSSDIELFGPVVVDVRDEELSQEELNAKCYARIFRLENRLRTFIGEAMTARYGTTWYKQLPADVKENLNELQIKKRNAGEERTLIECTDFSHYTKIIMKGDLWRDVFSPLFDTRRKEDVQESLNRLKPVRDTTMHSNAVSHEDWVMLNFETGRLLKVISKLH